MAISSTPRLTILTRLGVVAALVLASCGSDRLLDDADAGRTDAAAVAPSCSSSMTPIERVPVVIQFLVDASLSMQYGGIWPATRQASLASFADLQATADASTFIGLSFFPSTYTIRPGSFLDKAHYDSMVEIIDVSGVGGGTDEYGTTPTYWGLTRAYNVIEAFEPPSNQGLKVSETKRVVVLLSDGAPTDDSTNRIVPLVKAKYESTPSIRTFSVAILPLAQGQGVDFMGRVAVAGGTAPAGCEEDSLDVAKVCHFHIVPNGVSDVVRVLFYSERLHRPRRREGHGHRSRRSRDAHPEGRRERLVLRRRRESHEGGLARDVVLGGHGRSVRPRRRRARLPRPAVNRRIESASLCALASGLHLDG